MADIKKHLSSTAHEMLITGDEPFLSTLGYIGEA